MGNLLTIQIPYISFLEIEQNINKYIIINTLDVTLQDCLILNTIHANTENETINKLNKKETIIVYGKNCRDRTPMYKYNQLKKLGFENVYVYIGGLFEWCSLQEIYGTENFKTTKKCSDLLLYK